jgi:hypothetical protein
MNRDDRYQGLKELVRLSRELVYLTGPQWIEDCRRAVESGDAQRVLDALRANYVRLIKMLDGRHRWN